MKKLLPLVLSLVLALALVGCGEKAAPREEAASGENAQIANPYVTLSSAEEMLDTAGLTVSLPAQLPDWVTETVYRAMPGKLMEVIYRNDTNEIRVRAALGTEDISGVYDSESAVLVDMTVQGNTVHMKGKGDLVNLATWTDGTMTFSVSSPAGIDLAVMEQIVAEIH